MGRYLISRYKLADAERLIGRALIPHAVGLTWAEVSLKPGEAAILRKDKSMRLEIA